MQPRYDILEMPGARARFFKTQAEQEFEFIQFSTNLRNLSQNFEQYICISSLCGEALLLYSFQDSEFQLKRARSLDSRIVCSSFIYSAAVKSYAFSAQDGSHHPYYGECAWRFVSLLNPRLYHTGGICMCWSSLVWAAAWGLLQFSELYNDPILLASGPESREFLHTPQYHSSKLDVPSLFLDMAVPGVFCYGNFISDCVCHWRNEAALKQSSQQSIYSGNGFK